MLLPYTWLRCSGCGKWRCVGRGVKAEDETKGGKWFCVMNWWDEKIASCGAREEGGPEWPVGEDGRIQKDGVPEFVRFGEGK
jgi:hypothetical protein